MHLIENGYFSSSLWYREGLEVTMEHAVEMLNEGATSDNVSFLKPNSKLYFILVNLYAL
jgi:hypothetical protein